MIFFCFLTSRIVDCNILLLHLIGGVKAKIRSKDWL
nr:MAG TPA: hypothetical protein [Caudoviricetes sp.]